MKIKQTEVINNALDTLMKACGFQGESGTEELFDALSVAMENVQNEWHVVEQSHKDGLCYDVNHMLARALVKELSERETLFVETRAQ